MQRGNYYANDYKSSHLMNSLRQGTASAVPKRPENSGVLTPEVGTMLSQGIYEIGR